MGQLEFTGDRDVVSRLPAIQEEWIAAPTDPRPTSRQVGTNPASVSASVICTRDFALVETV